MLPMYIKTYLQKKINRKLILAHFNSLFKLTFTALKCVFEFITIGNVP